MKKGGGARIPLLLEARLQPFCSSRKHSHRGLEVKRPFDLYWWAGHNFGQQPEFLEASVWQAVSNKSKRQVQIFNARFKFQRQVQIFNVRFKFQPDVQHDLRPFQFGSHTRFI